MNPRIRELLGQADIKFDKDLNEIDVCVLLPEDLEKFARLIVEECAMTQPMQPCEACPNWYAQQKLKERK